MIIYFKLPSTHLIILDFFLIFIFPSIYSEIISKLTSFYLLLNLYFN